MSTNSVELVSEYSQILEDCTTSTFGGYTGNPSTSITDRIRLEVGDIDTDEEGLSDSVYQYILTKNGDSTTGIVSSASIVEALKYLVAKYANFESERAGGLSIGGDQYKRYQKLLDNYLKNPTYGGAAVPVPFAGGIHRDTIESNNSNDNNNKVSPSESWFSTTDTELSPDKWR